MDAARRDAGRHRALYTAARCAMVGGPRSKDRTSLRLRRRVRRGAGQPLTREIRVPRLVGAFAAGRIMNPRTARSQLHGRHDLGHVSSALHEATEIDERYARYVNDNLADYLVPVNADINERRGDPGARGGRPGQSGRRQGPRRARQCRHQRRGRQRGLSRDGQTDSRSANPHRGFLCLRPRRPRYHRPGMRRRISGGIANRDAFTFPGTSQAPFPDNEAFPHDCVATNSEFAHSALN